MEGQKVDKRNNSMSLEKLFSKEKIIIIMILDDHVLVETNLENDHEFINEEYSLHWYEAF